ncbi:hypothetical protein GWI33_003119 [Rhynchophorus ferrugineus]|uniref:LIM zinc-binding domain-containing protein n=1 Tax=Rhynchophorus ferrugineus TaxID=354439 RepID=A0A834INV7_RHYFE|nr:hypothetical protein GWI33_003119 [Rhynchophorus ferrugineus]
MNPADWSSDDPSLGSASDSDLAKVVLRGNYYKFEEYDNISLTDINIHSCPNTVYNSFVSRDIRFSSRAVERQIPIEKKRAYSTGNIPYQNVFTCAQCFRTLTGEVFYQYDGRQYCQYDFNMLFAPYCERCRAFIVGRVIKAMNVSWHPECFQCKLCRVNLADTRFTQNNGNAVCYKCNSDLKAGRSLKYICRKCNEVIDDQPLRYDGEVYHPYHFRCTLCSIELDANARVLKYRPNMTRNDKNKLYCLRCYDKMRLRICGGCRRPIEERVVVALGKYWHVEHFVCAKCDRPFFGHRHYEKKGLAYCKYHYFQLFGDVCDTCHQISFDHGIRAMNKFWCINHFKCSICDSRIKPKAKFFPWDLKPVCQKCCEKIPKDVRDSVIKLYEVDKLASISTYKTSKCRIDCLSLT